ncbi:ankyrin repeat-containing domain protein [Trichoderma chlorosporum]
MKRALTFGKHQDGANGTEKRLKTSVCDQNSFKYHLQQKTNEEYTIGWICAVTTEYVAAQAVLDEIHQGPERVSHANQSDYTLGSIGKHNVVIATLPYGEYGTASAAAVAKDLSHNFPNISTRLIVGIGGGAPSKRTDIRLGDIVVSAPRDGKSGVLQYDFGKTIQDQPFQTTRVLDQPPMVLRTAMSGLIAQYEREGHQIEETVNTVLERSPRLQEKYSRPHESSDRLYISNFVHSPNSAADCATSCGNDALVVRSKRTREKSDPTIHYGLIASANQLMKDATIRDKLSSEYDILCFEMEAGGLMNQFPCLVIRGICDYSDSHKNKAWQGYAAMTAAAYAKDLVNRLPPIDFNVPQRGVDLSSGQFSLKETTPDPDRAEQISELLKSLRFDQMDARQMTIKAAYAETCRWLLCKPEYLDWLDTAKIDEHRGFLWIKGKPGTGKSTLMKFALDSAKKTMRDKVIIHFFFNARGEDLEKSTTGMYQSLLLQLLERLPTLQDVLELPKVTTRLGKDSLWSTESLTNLLDQAIQNLNKSRVICFIDALDECEEDQIRKMIQFFQGVSDTATTGSFRVCFSSRHYPHISISRGLTLILEGQEGHAQDMISYINSEMKIGSSALANQIRTELQQKASGVFMWVVLVVNILKKDYDKGRIHVLRKRLEEISADLHELFRDILTRDRQDAHELLLCIQWVLFSKLPLRPEQLYFALLSDCQDEPNSNSDLHEGDTNEIPYQWDPKEVTVLDIERFILNASKGLTEITKSKVPTVQFIHESVKDYLLKDKGLRDIWPDSQANIYGESHERLKQCCLKYIAIGKVDYLKMCDISAKAASKKAESQRQLTKAAFDEAESQRRLAKSSFPLLEYAVRNVLHHANEAEANGVNQAGFLQRFQLNYWIQLDNLLEEYDYCRHTQKASLLYILAEFNMGHLIRRHPETLSFLKIEEERYGTPIFAALATNSSESVWAFLYAYLKIGPSFREIIDVYCSYDTEWNGLDQSFTFSRNSFFEDIIKRGATLAAALSLTMGDVSMAFSTDPQSFLQIASDNGRESVLKLLISKSATGIDHQKLFLGAVSHGHENVAHFLLDNGAKADGADQSGQSPLSMAAEKGLYSLVKRLLDDGAEIDVLHKGRTPLSYAVEHYNVATVKLLVERGAEVDARDETNMTPLSCAAGRGKVAAIECLLKAGADIEAKEKSGRTPLLIAAKYGEEAAVKLLLERGAEADARDETNRTPLLTAAKYGKEAAVKLLVERGAEVDARDKTNRTPLSYAARHCMVATVELLLKAGADIETNDDSGRTPLSYAAERPSSWYNNGDAEALPVVKRLLEGGANVEAKDKVGRTPLSYAAEHGPKNRVQLLLEKGADIHAQDNYGRTLMHYGVDSEETVQLLLETSAKVDVEDNNGDTPLLLAVQISYPDEAAVESLLDRGANINAQNKAGRTPLSYAATGNSERLVKLLLGRGADVNAKDFNGRSPLSHAVVSDYEAESMVKLLLEGGVDINARDDNGRTPLSHAVVSDSVTTESIVKLLLKGGADVDARDNCGRTPLSYAVSDLRVIRRKQPIICTIKLLLESGADINAKDSEGRTPLWHGKINGLERTLLEWKNTSM